MLKQNTNSCEQISNIYVKLSFFNRGFASIRSAPRAAPFCQQNQNGKSKNYHWIIRTKYFLRWQDRIPSDNKEQDSKNTKKDWR